MDKSAATQKFQQSKQLFSQQRYADALVVLDELNAAFPRQQELLYARALCLAELQRPQEALSACEQSIQLFDDTRAKALKAQIERESVQAPASSTDFAGLSGGALGAGLLDDLPSLSGFAGIPPLPEPGSVPQTAHAPVRPSRRKPLVLAGCALAALVLFVLGTPFLSCMQDSGEVATVEDGAPTQPAPETTPAPAAQPAAVAEAESPGQELRGCPRPATIGGSGTAETIGQDFDTLTLLKIQGNRYELGYWYGKLLGDQIGETWKLVQAMAQREGIPMPVVEAAAGQLWQEKNFDLQPWNTELQGIADGCAEAGHPEITFTVLKQIASIPDLSEHSCSLFVAWGNATLDGETYQMRNLDWSMDTGFQNYPVVAVYTPDDGVKHAVVGFAGVIGVSVGGMNVEGLAVSEIMGHFCDKETLEGIPFPFLLRDVLYFDRDLQAGLDRMKSAKRTNQYHYALADPNAEDPKGRLLFTSTTRFDEFIDNQSVDPHPCPDVTPFHESLDDVVYWKNHNGRDNDVLHGAILERYGQIDAEKAIEIARIACVKGTLVSIIYHNSGNDMWVAFAEGETPGPQQEYVHIQLDD